MSKTPSEESYPRKIGYDHIRSVIQFCAYPSMAMTFIHILSPNKEQNFDRVNTLDIDEDGFIERTFGDREYHRHMAMMHPTITEALVRADSVCMDGLIEDRKNILSYRSNVNSNKELIHTGYWTAKKAKNLLELKEPTLALAEAYESAMVLAFVGHYWGYPELANAQDIFKMYPDSLICQMFENSGQLTRNDGLLSRYIYQLLDGFEKEFTASWFKAP